MDICRSDMGESCGIYSDLDRHARLHHGWSYGLSDDYHEIIDIEPQLGSLGYAMSPIILHKHHNTCVSHDCARSCDHCDRAGT